MVNNENQVYSECGHYNGIPLDYCTDQIVRSYDTRSAQYYCENGTFIKEEYEGSAECGSDGLNHTISDYTLPDCISQGWDCVCGDGLECDIIKETESKACEYGEGAFNSEYYVRNVCIRGTSYSYWSKNWKDWSSRMYYCNTEESNYYEEFDDDACSCKYEEIDPSPIQCSLYHTAMDNGNICGHFKQYPLDECIWKNNGESKMYTCDSMTNEFFLYQFWNPSCNVSNDTSEFYLENVDVEWECDGQGSMSCECGDPLACDIYESVTVTNCDGDTKNELFIPNICVWNENYEYVDAINGYVGTYAMYSCDTGFVKYYDPYCIETTPPTYTSTTTEAPCDETVICHTVEDDTNCKHYDVYPYDICQVDGDGHSWMLTCDVSTTTMTYYEGTEMCDPVAAMNTSEHSGNCSTTSSGVRNIFFPWSGLGFCNCEGTSSDCNTAEYVTDCGAPWIFVTDKCIPTGDTYTMLLCSEYGEEGAVEKCYLDDICTIETDCGDGDNDEYYDIDCEPYITRCIVGDDTPCGHVYMYPVNECMYEDGISWMVECDEILGQWQVMYMGLDCDPALEFNRTDISEYCAIPGVCTCGSSTGCNRFEQESLSCNFIRTIVYDLCIPSPEQDEYKIPIWDMATCNVSETIRDYFDDACTVPEPPPFVCPNGEGVSHNCNYATSAGGNCSYIWEHPVGECYLTEENAILVSSYMWQCETDPLSGTSIFRELQFNTANCTGEPELWDMVEEQCSVDGRCHCGPPGNCDVMETTECSVQYGETELARELKVINECDYWVINEYDYWETGGYVCDPTDGMLYDDVLCACYDVTEECNMVVDDSECGHYGDTPLDTCMKDTYDDCSWRITCDIASNTYDRTEYFGSVDCNEDGNAYEIHTMDEGWCSEAVSGCNCGDPAKCNVFTRTKTGCEESRESWVINKCIDNNDYEWKMITMDDCNYDDMNWEYFYDEACTITERPQCTFTYDFVDDCVFPTTTAEPQPITTDETQPTTTEEIQPITTEPKGTEPGGTETEPEGTQFEETVPNETGPGDTENPIVTETSETSEGREGSAAVSYSFLCVYFAVILSITIIF